MSSAAAGDVRGQADKGDTQAPPCDAWAVDWRGGRLEPETPAILFVNLLAADDQKIFAKLLEQAADTSQKSTQMVSGFGPRASQAPNTNKPNALFSMHRIISTSLER